MHGQTGYSVKEFREQDQPALADEWFAFRYDLFVRKLGWHLPSSIDRERDDFDHEHAVHCIVRQHGRVVAGFRAIRTDHPYLARTLFGHLALFRPLPNDTCHWEISRFGLEYQPLATDLAELLYGLIFRFAYAHGARSLVALVDLAHERNLTRKGIGTRRYGPPQLIGVDRRDREIIGVVGEIPLHDQSDARFSRILAVPLAPEIHHEAHVL